MSVCLLDFFSFGSIVADIGFGNEKKYPNEMSAT